MTRVAMFAVLVTSCVHVAPAPVAPMPAEEIIARVLPSVVLLVAVNATGSGPKTTFGAGLIVSHDSLVLTNRHIVAEGTLFAMLYSPEVVSYTPMDGGLDRFLYENSARLVPVEVIRADETTDLALVRIGADTAKTALLPLAASLPHRGQKVLAFGHPRETVWSFTSGVVSALHHGAIQHDAAINPGSSGGPLLNDRGEVIGLNTSRLFGDTNGVGFARPIEMARWMFEGGTEPFEMDQSTPEKAASSCIRAQELGSPNLVECFDWNMRWETLEASARSLPAPAAQLIVKALEAEGGRQGWLARTREALVEFIRTGQRKPRPAPSGLLPPLPAALRQVVEAYRRDDARLNERLERANGFKLNLRDQKLVRASIRKGVRVEASLHTRPTLAWVMLAGRNPDGTEYRFSEAWEEQPDGRWLQHWPATRDDLASLPAWFAPPIDGTDEVARRFQVELLEKVYLVEARPPEAPTRQVTPPAPGDGHLSGVVGPAAMP